MVAMSATTTSRGGKPHVAPSFYVGGFMPNDKEFGDFKLSVMAFTMADKTLEAFAYTQS
jgi:hypothetical protein